MLAETGNQVQPVQLCGTLEELAAKNCSMSSIIPPVDNNSGVSEETLCVQNYCTYLCAILYYAAPLTIIHKARKIVDAFLPYFLPPGP